MTEKRRRSAVRSAVMSAVMSCNICAQTRCCCTNTTTTCETTSNCLGVEDLCFGFGVLKQTRHCKIVDITKINCTSIPCPDGKSVGTHIADIEATRHKHYPDLASTKTTIPAPDGSPVIYMLTLNIGDTILIDDCVYTNLVADNQNRPTDITVLDGDWSSSCDDKAVKDCVIPRHKDCMIGEDGCAVVVNAPTLCERTATIEECLFPIDTNGNVLPTLCERVGVIENHTDANTYPTEFTLDTVNNRYVITLNDTTELYAPCCSPETTVVLSDTDGIAFIEQSSLMDQFVRNGKITIVTAGTYQVSSQNVVFISVSDVGQLPANPISGHEILINGVKTGRGFWSTDRIISGIGDTADHPSVGSQVLVLAAGDEITMQVTSGDSNDSSHSSRVYQGNTPALNGLNIASYIEVFRIGV